MITLTIIDTLLIINLACVLEMTLYTSGVVGPVMGWQVDTTVRTKHSLRANLPDTVAHAVRSRQRTSPHG